MNSKILKRKLNKIVVTFLACIMVLSLCFTTFANEVYDNTLDSFLVRSYRTGSIGGSYTAAGYEVSSSGTIIQYTSASSMQVGYLVFDLSQFAGKTVYLNYTVSFVGSSLGTYNCYGVLGSSNVPTAFSSQKGSTFTSGSVSHSAFDTNGFHGYSSFDGVNSVSVSSLFTVSSGGYTYVYIGAGCTSAACVQFQYTNIDMVVIDKSTADILNNIYTRLGTMNSAIGSIYSLLQTVNGSISAILSDTASIDTNVSSINTKLSNIYNSLGTISTYLGNLQKGFFGSGTISAFSFYDLLKQKVFNEFFGETSEDVAEQEEIDNAISEQEKNVSDKQETAIGSITDMNSKFDEYDELENGYINTAISDIDSISTNFDFETNAKLFTALTFVSEQITYVYNGLGSYQIVVVVGLTCGILVLVVGVAKNVRHEVHTPVFSHRKDKIK